MESPINTKTGEKQTFFKLGPKNEWKNLLDKDFVKKIENCFETEMEELGYL